MARRGRRGEAVPISAVARMSEELATIGTEGMPWKESDITWIFKTVAIACKDRRDQWLYLKTCQAQGLNPLKRELFAIEFKTKSGGKRIAFVTSYHVFVSRARQAGFVVSGMEVYSNDEFEGWDAVHNVPVKHVVKLKNRGELMGAWANATQVSTGKVVAGKYWPKAELLSDNANPLRDKIPAHFCWKTAVCRIARLVAPDLSSLYGAEEMGVMVATDAEAERVPRDVSDIANQAAEDQLRAQDATGEDKKPSTADDIRAAQGEPEDVTPEEPKQPAEDDPAAVLPAKEQIAVKRAIAMLGHRTADAMCGYLSEALGREFGVSDLKSITRGDLAVLQEKGLEVAL